LLQFIDPNSPPKIVNLGPASGASLREWIDNQTQAITRKHRKLNDALLDSALCTELDGGT
jgi:hypothetical protein